MDLLAKTEPSGRGVEVDWGDQDPGGGGPVRVRLQGVQVAGGLDTPDLPRQEEQREPQQYGLRH